MLALYCAAVFFVLSLIAAVVGFGLPLVGGAATVAKTLFFVFLLLGSLLLIFGKRVPV